MAALTFDTLKFAQRLKTAGVPHEHAIAEADALRDVLSEALDSTLATKTDITELRHELKSDIAELRHELKCQVSRLDAKMDSKFALMDGKFDKMSWMLGVVIALAVANFARQFF